MPESCEIYVFSSLRFIRDIHIIGALSTLKKNHLLFLHWSLFVVKTTPGCPRITLNYTWNGPMNWPMVTSNDSERFLSVE